MNYPLSGAFLFFENPAPYRQPLDFALANPTQDALTVAGALRKEVIRV